MKMQRAKTPCARVCSAYKAPCAISRSLTSKLGPNVAIWAIYSTLFDFRVHQKTKAAKSLCFFVGELRAPGDSVLYDATITHTKLRWEIKRVLHHQIFTRSNKQLQLSSLFQANHNRRYRKFTRIFRFMIAETILSLKPDPVVKDTKPTDSIRRIFLINED